METSNPPLQTQRPMHLQSRSSGSGTTMKVNNPQVNSNTSSNRRDQNNRNRRQQQYPSAPAWDSANVTNPNEGYFDTNGKFVVGQPQGSASSAEDSPAPRRTSQPANQQQARNKHDDINVGNSSPANPKVERTNAELRSTSPDPPTAATPAKQAYAGPTFHASPAASALPMPSFFSKTLTKSLPTTAASSQPSLQARLDQESSGSERSNEESPTTSLSNPTTSIPPREESPLDIFFRADREEKAKRAANSQNPATPNGKLPVPSLQPAQSAPPHANNWAEIYGNSYRHHSRTASHDSQREVFPLELDGTTVQPKQPPSNPLRDITNSQDRQHHPLRNFLHATADAGSSSPGSLPSPEHHLAGYSSDHQDGSPFFRHQPQARSSSGPSTPSPYVQQDHKFHYGNRNLSPLFQAASNPPQGRSSSSLRREVTSSPTAGSVELPAFSTPPPPSSQSPSTINRSRSYGDRMSNTNRTGTPDVKSMEDDLRRMLKITAFGDGARA